MTQKDALDEAIKECIDEHVLEEFFRKRGNEVKRVEVLDFTFERRIEIATREARLEGEACGEARGEAHGEARGERIGKSKALLTLLEDVGNVPSNLEEQIRRQEDEVTLTRWIKLAARAESIEDFEQKISNR